MAGPTGRESAGGSHPKHHSAPQRISHRVPMRARFPSLSKCAVVRCDALCAIEHERWRQAFEMAAAKNKLSAYPQNPPKRLRSLCSCPGCAERELSCQVEVHRREEAKTNAEAFLRGVGRASANARMDCPRIIELAANGSRRVFERRRKNIFCGH
jgi:hypothetical protein